MGTLSISRAISHHAAERPHDPALTCGDVTRSWSELDRLTKYFAPEILNTRDEVVGSIRVNLQF